MAYIYDLADVWNAAGTTFTAIKMSVTDTASSAGSLLMDLQVGGASRFKVDKTGVALADNLATITGGSGYGFRWAAGLGVGYYYGGSLTIGLDNGRIQFPSSGVVGWSSGGAPTTTPDLSLFRDAANTLAQRNGVNAQAFNLYNTYTDASNYERGFMRWSASQLNIGAEAAGTGTARNVNLSSASILFLDSAVSVRFTSGGAAGAFFVQSNQVRIANFGLTFCTETNYNTPEFSILRDAANTLGQRNGTNAQTVNLYGTYTDAANYRRLTKTMSTAGVAVIKPEGAGTGASGNVLHISGLPTSNPGPGILWNNAGTPAIGT